MNRRHLGIREAANEPYGVVKAETPVLVCIDADGVCAAWVLLDDEAVARPNDFDNRRDHHDEVVHLERRRSVAAFTGQLHIASQRVPLGPFDL